MADILLIQQTFSSCLDNSIPTRFAADAACSTSLLYRIAKRKYFVHSVKHSQAICCFDGVYIVALWHVGSVSARTLPKPCLNIFTRPSFKLCWTISSPIRNCDRYAQNIMLHCNTTLSPTYNTMHALPLSHQFDNSLIRRQRWTALICRRRELGLSKHLLHAILLSLKLVVHLVEVLQAHTMRHHLQRVDLTLLYHLKQRLPVLVHGGLTITNKANATFHQGANVEMVGLARHQFSILLV